MKRTIGMVIFFAITFACVVVVSLIRQSSISSIQTKIAAPVPKTKSYSRRDDEAWNERYVKPIEMPQEFRKLFAEGEPAYTEKQAQEWVDQLLPIVENVAQRSFAERPTVILGNRKQLAESLVRDLLPQMHYYLTEQHKHSGVTELILAQGQASLIAPSLLGKYGIIDQVLYLAPTNLQSVIDVMEIEQDLIEPITMLIVVHELTHALQDQIVGLKPYLDYQSSYSSNQAAQATIEGHAVFIEELVAHELGYEEAARTFARLLSSNPYALDDPEFQELMEMVKTPQEQIYLGGRDFISYHFEKGGMDRIWEILANPPSSTTMISAPAMYGTELAIDINLSKVLSGLESFYGKGDWRISESTYTSIELRSLYSMLDSDVRDDIASSVQQSFVRSASRWGTGESGIISVMLLTNDSFGSRFIKASEDMLRQQSELMIDAEHNHASNFSIEEFKGVTADVARLVSFDIQHGDGKSIPNRSLRVLRGKALIEITDDRIYLEDETFISIIEEIFKRMGEYTEGSSSN